MSRWQDRCQFHISGGLSVEESDERISSVDHSYSIMYEEFQYSAISFLNRGGTFTNADCFREESQSDSIRRNR